MLKLVTYKIFIARPSLNTIHLGRYVFLKRLLSLFLGLSFLVVAEGQTSYVKPKAAVAGYTMYVEITTPADLQFVASNLSSFAQVQRIRVSADIDIAVVQMALVFVWLHRNIGKQTIQVSWVT